MVSFLLGLTCKLWYVAYYISKIVTYNNYLCQNAVNLTSGDPLNAVIESNAICEYLDDAFEARPVRATDPAKLAQMRLWTKQIDEGVHAATAIISNCIAFRYQHLQKAPEAIERWLNNIPNPVRRER